MVIVSCANVSAPAINEKTIQQIVKGNSEDENPFTAIGSIPAPKNFHRVKKDSNSFAFWLQQVTLKKNKTVFRYDGSRKANQSAQFAVLDISVGNKNLQQCADAVMRLRAEYLFSQRKYEQIIFIDNEHNRYQFNTPYTRDNFASYMEKVFACCGSASLAKQLHPIDDPATIKPGDVLIRGGFPGHAVIVMDVVENNEGKKMYLLAQSYMPAQDIHVLQNPMNEKISPWYEVNEEESIVTPEYCFRNTEWKRW